MQALPDRDAVCGVDILRAVCLDRDGRVHQEVPGREVGKAEATEDGSTGKRAGK